MSDEGSHDGEQVVPLVRQAPEKAKGAKVVQEGRFERMVGELKLKVWVYNLLIGLAVGLDRA